MENSSAISKLSQTSYSAGHDIMLVNELPDHQEMIEELNREAFGPARFTRAAHLIREQSGHDDRLSFVAMLDKSVVGTVRMTPIMIGEIDAYLLGPIVIAPSFKNLGLGGRLMRHTIEAAKEDGVPLILLVGDEPYYRRFDFKKVPEGEMIMPAPVNPARFLALELVNSAMEQAKGIVRHR